MGGGETGMRDGDGTVQNTPIERLGLAFAKINKQLEQMHRSAPCLSPHQQRRLAFMIRV